MCSFCIIVTLFGVKRFEEYAEVTQAGICLKVGTTVTQAVILLESGYTQRTVAESFDVPSSVVARL